MAEVAGVISVVGTAAGIIDRNDQASRQNAQIRAQQEATLRAQRIKLLQIEQQRAFADEQYRLDIMQRDANAVLQQQQLDIASMQAMTQQTAATSGIDRQMQAAQLQQLGNNFTALQAEFNASQQARQAEMSAQQEAAQGFDQLSQVAMQVQDALAKGDTQRAALIAQQAAQGSGVTSNSDKMRQQKIDNQMTLEAMMSMIRQGQASEAMVAQVVQSQEFADILRQLGIVQGQNIRSASNAQLDQAMTLRNTNQFLVDNNARAQQDYLSRSRGMVETSRQIGNTQAGINRGYQDLNFLTDQWNTGAQTSASMAQLESQKQSGVGFLSAIGSLAGAAMPLISTWMKSSPTSQTAPSQALPDTPAYYGYQTTTGVSNKVPSNYYEYLPPMSPIGDSVRYEQVYTRPTR